MGEKAFYVTTAIPYVNARLHLGHIYEAIITDACARYHRLKGEKVFFLTGTDEHGQKIYRSALRLGMSPQQFVDQMAAEVRRLWDLFEVSYDDFIRTTEPRHEMVVKEWFRRAYASGDIYLGTYSGWYCVECETHFLDSQVVEGKCPDCGRPIEWVEEKNYFFRLSKYAKPLLRHIEKNPNFVIPEVRKNEVVSFIKQGLNDISISRTAVKWGVEIPFDPEHVSYVWVDALINYISAPGAFFDTDRFNTIWPADFHNIGKDILKFHAIIWPAMLMSAGLELPRTVAVHGWLLAEEEKMSKSKGNILDPDELSQVYGVDALRYFLLKEISFGQDGSFSHELMQKTYNSDLSNDLGNLLSRTLAMIERYCSSRIPEPAKYEESDGKVIEGFRTLLSELDASMEVLDFRGSLVKIWEYINSLNRYLDFSAPWALEREGKKDRLATVLYVVCEGLRLIGMLIFPYMPATAARIWEQLGIKDDIAIATVKTHGVWGLLEAGAPIGKREPLFPRFARAQ